MKDHEGAKKVQQNDVSTPKAAGTALQRAIVALERAEKKIVALESIRNEPIAIIGMACRFPGNASDLDSFWRVIRDGVDEISEVPENRWEMDPSYPPGSRWGGFIQHLDEFDAAFFGISPREADQMDPQQRVVLEVAWQAMEHAGLPALAGSNTGVFVGCVGSEYAGIVAAADWRNRHGVHALTGILGGALAGRVSYTFGFQGPCLVVDTSCSSALSAIHLACRSIRAGECDIALAGGINIMLSPVGTCLLGEMAALSPDGHCRTFDAGANGYVRGEGCGMVALKRLSDAERDGDRIWAVIRGSAMNQDGRSSGLTAPNVLAQQAVLRKAMAEARVSPAQLNYVEVHGTGTPLGDPIEFEGLREVLGKQRPDGSVCMLGAVKANIGHLEGAAGVAGLIKIALMFQHETIPGQIHLETLNPKILLEGTPFVIPSRNCPWPPGDTKPIAGLSSFGASGTNVHAILQAPGASVMPDRPTVSASAYQLLTLSAKTRNGLAALAASYSEYLRNPHNESVELQDIVYTASARRTHHEQRLAVVGASKHELADALVAFARGEMPIGLEQGQARTDTRQKVAFVFSGQGSQWPGMGQELLRTEPVFRATIEQCNALIEPLTGWSLLEELLRPEESSRLGETEIAQPALFAIEVGLAALYTSWGIVPSAVIGHSIGEISAAHVAGILDLEDAVRLVVLRGRIMQKATGFGKMILASISETQAREALDEVSAHVSIAAINDPHSIVLSGEPGTLDAIADKLRAGGASIRPLPVNYAFHSPQMAPLRDELVRAVGKMKSAPAVIPMYSTVTGETISGSQLDADYWGNNIRATVQFARAIQSASDEGLRLFVEIGPHPVLSLNIEHCLVETTTGGHAFPTLRRKQDERRSVCNTLGALFVHGYKLDWKRIAPPSGIVVPLPGYPFQRQRFELPRTMSTPRVRSEEPSSQVTSGHPLLGTVMTISTLPGTRIWQTNVGTKRQPFLADHRIQGEIVFPGSACLEMVIAAASEVHGPWNFDVHDVSFEHMCVLGEDEERIIQLVLKENDARTSSFHISSRAMHDIDWTLHYAGSVTYAAPAKPPMAKESPEEIQARCPKIVSGAAHYAEMVRRSMCFGPMFQGVVQIWQGTSEVLGRVRLTEGAAKDAHNYRTHPAFLDPCGQVMFPLVMDANDATDQTSYVGMQVGRARAYGALPSEVWVHIKAPTSFDHDHGVQAFHMIIMDDEGRILLEGKEGHIRQLARGKAASRTIADSNVFTIEWQKLRPSSPTTTPLKVSDASWLVFLDNGGLGAAVVSKLRSFGQECIGVLPGDEFNKVDEHTYCVDPGAREHFTRLLEETFGPQRRCRGVLYLWSLDGADWEQTNTDTITFDSMRGTIGGLHLTQSLLERGWRELPPLWLTTRGVHDAGNEAPRSISVSQAPLWGLGQTIQLEAPEMRCVCLDLSSEPMPDETNWLLNELAVDDVEGRVALRSTGRLVARFVRSSFGAKGKTPHILHADATYVITGGLGGLGFSLAQSMVENGARHLILTSRRAPTPAVQAEIGEMERAGATVRVFEGDVSRREDVVSMLALIDERMPALRGIVHAAGVLDDHALLTLSADHFKRVFAPKVFGTWLLHELTKHRTLDFFVLYSSLSAAFGSPGQANYSAANAFLDAMARARNVVGLPGMSIQWGAFSDVGMAAAQANRGARVADVGLASLSPAQGNVALARLLERPRAEVSIQRLDVQRFFDAHPQLASMPFFADLRKGVRLAETGPNEFTNLKDAISAAGPEHGHQMLVEHVKHQLGRVLHQNPADVVEDLSFPQLGIDSLMSLELRNRLEISLGVRLQATALFTHPDAKSLATHLLHHPGLSPTNR